MKMPVQAKTDHINQSGGTEPARFSGQGASSEFIDNRPAAVAQRQHVQIAHNSPRSQPHRALAATMNNSSRMVAQQQKSAALFGPTPQRIPAPASSQDRLPDQLKAGVESLSGMSMDHVKVHYNSPQPAQLNAHAYARGSDIHIAPGQERHLPHEAWHVVQQAQDRVKPTTQAKGIEINDRAGLESEADIMGEKALAAGQLSQPAQLHFDGAGRSGNVGSSPLNSSIVQCVVYKKNVTRVPPAAVSYSQATVRGITTPKKMEARNLSATTIGGGSARDAYENHSNLYKAFMTPTKIFPWDNLQDCHLLHEELGGPGVPRNLVPAPDRTNNNMLDFERMAIDAVTRVPKPDEMAVIDYEVNTNYGRTGDTLAAAMPTSFDMRMTEQKTENGGNTWLDGPSYVRNVAITPTSPVGAAAPQHAPADEALITAPLPRKPRLHKIANAIYASIALVKGKVVSQEKLYYFVDYGLISRDTKDSAFQWTQGNANAALTEWFSRFKATVDTILNEADIAADYVARIRRVWETDWSIARAKLLESLEQKHYGWDEEADQQLRDIAGHWIDIAHEAIEGYWKDPDCITSVAVDYEDLRETMPGILRITCLRVTCGERSKELESYVDNAEFESEKDIAEFVAEDLKIDVDLVTVEEE
jgi:hypothetical protein